MKQRKYSRFWVHQHFFRRLHIIKELDRYVNQQSELIVRFYYQSIKHRGARILWCNYQSNIHKDTKGVFYDFFVLSLKQYTQRYKTSKFFICPTRISFQFLIFYIIKNVSSSTSHQKTLSLRLSVFPSLRLSLREFKKSLSNTFIYEKILINFSFSITSAVIGGHKMPLLCLF